MSSKCLTAYKFDPRVSLSDWSDYADLSFSTPAADKVSTVVCAYFDIRKTEEEKLITSLLKEKNLGSFELTHSDSDFTIGVRTKEHVVVVSEEAAAKLALIEKKSKAITVRETGEDEDKKYDLTYEEIKKSTDSVVALYNCENLIKLTTSVKDYTSMKIFEITKQ